MEYISIEGGNMWIDTMGVSSIQVLNSFNSITNYEAQNIPPIYPFPVGLEILINVGMLPIINIVLAL